MDFEWSHLTFASRVVPECTPKLYHYSHNEHILLMEYLDNHQTMRNMLIQGHQCSGLDIKISNYLVQTLHQSSPHHLSPNDVDELIKHYTNNSELCSVTETVIFKEPYQSECPSNCWTKNSKELDDLIHQIQSNALIRSTVSSLLNQFRTQKQSVVHGDLHTGSIMVRSDTGSVVVIDPEFAFYGPSSFDIGLLLANLFIAFIAQRAYPGDRRSYAKWIGALVVGIWNQFKIQFKNLQYSDQYLDDLFVSSLKFASLEVIRRVIGMASCGEMLAIEDETQRARCECVMLLFGTRLLLCEQDGNFSYNIQNVVDVLEQF
ncbi:5-methylthioribose kinase [Acrasis kona]|uniref:5-methylthioribose kinase n=1 Tax=Acrasis kona TaxID=1008807 RepID=A0AAW2ZK36_9EUKA